MIMFLIDDAFFPTGMNSGLVWSKWYLGFSF